MKRKGIVLLLALVFLFSFSVFALAADTEAKLDHVTDAADLLTDSQWETLETRAAALSEQYGCGVYIVVVDDMNSFSEGGSGIERFGEQVFTNYLLGYGEEKNGVMLSLSMADRDYDILAHGSIGHEAFTDYGKEVLADQFLDDFRYDNWYDGLEDYVNGCGEMLEAWHNGSPIDSYGGYTERTRGITGGRVFGSSAASAVIAFIACAVLKGKNKSVRRQTNANAYVAPGSLALRTQLDQYTHTTEVRRTIESSNRGSGGGGGTTINSGGFSHHSGKF